MRHSRLNNRIAEHVLTLPVCAALAVAIPCLRRTEWVVDATLWREVGGLLLTILTAYVVMETSNVHLSLHVRTRLGTGLWLLLAAAILPPGGSSLPLAGACCSAVCYYLLFSCYQRAESAGRFFHITLIMAAWGIWSPIPLLLVIPWCGYLTVFMRGMSVRAFCGGLVGLLLPYVLWVAWCFLSDDFTPLLSFVRRLAECGADLTHWWRPTLSALLAMPLAWKVTWAVLLFYSVVGLLHYWRTNYNDKIQTRMAMYVYSLQTLLLHLLVVVMPSLFPEFSALIVVSCTPLLSRYFAVTRSLQCQAVFVVSMVLYVLLLTLDVWVPLLS